MSPRTASSGRAFRWSLVTAAAILAIPVGARIAERLAPTAAAAATPAAPAAGPCTLPLPLPSEVGQDAFLARYDAFLSALCYVQLADPSVPKQIRWGHDAARRDASEVHGGWVANWYSPEVVAWLEAGRQGVIPSHGVIVKEMWANATCTDRKDPSCFFGTAPMFKDVAGAFDGWYWGSGMAPTDPTITYPWSGFGNYCLNCHASTVSESTYSDPAFLAGAQGPGDGAGPSTPPIPFHELRTEPPQVPRAVTAAGLVPERLAVAGFGDALRVPQGVGPLTLGQVRSLPGEALDHVVSAAGGPQQFLTSDQCIGCHDATSSNANPPNMIYCETSRGPVDCGALPADGRVLNFSPYAEAHGSMMGLSGRDPVFYAQVETEGVVHPTREGEIQNTCFSCHGVMGQRQLDIDRGQPFALTIVYATGDQPNAEFAALARDGVSCTVCHHIVIKDDVPFDKTFTGKFFVGPPEKLFGPFDQDVKVDPMENALGITPSGAVRAHDWRADVTSAKVCGSCHTVFVPVYDATGKQVGTSYEQATFIEWLNSIYQNETPPISPHAATCQDCHMPQKDGTVTLASKIANIEDNTFPPMKYQLPDEDLDLEVRRPFSRHVLSGINLFSLELFRQFVNAQGNNPILGIRTIDPMMVFGKKDQRVRPIESTLESSLEIANDQTVRLEVLSASREGSELEARIRLTNLAGHHFPSGVGFRRAFLDVQVLDAAGEVLWESGRSDDFGILLGANGLPLPSEFFLEVDGQQSFQPHYQVITSPDQVQIYEELTKSPPPESRFTTSFLSLYDHFKDNRLQPWGWRKDGPYADVTKPDGGALEDCAYTVKPGCAEFGKPSSGADEILYRVSMAGLAAPPVRVVATVYYQSLPPYYQAQRYSIFAHCSDPSSPACYPETRRLLYLASRLDTGAEIAGQKPIQGWKLRVTSTDRLVR